MLDIIIPTYKNKKGLIRTLESIDFNEEIKVTVVDDGSNLMYYDIIDQFPEINFYYKRANSGPGITRQVGINITNNSYIMFLDTGDYFIEKNIIYDILETIKNNPDIYLFSWQHLENGTPADESHVRLHGRVFSRTFIQENHITFSKEGSYINEDVGFNRCVRLFLKNYKQQENNSHKKIILKPIVVWDRTDPNSITKKNNGQILREKQNWGFAINAMHSLKIARKGHVSKTIIMEEISEVMIGLYYYFLRTLIEAPTYIQNAWDGAKLFYDKEFSKLTTIDPLYLEFVKKHMIKQLHDKIKNFDFPVPININRFLEELKNPQVPIFYLQTIDSN